jgi:ornithine decarboxylase
MANPCKPASHILSARNLGVTMMTFDNADELHKIKRLYPHAEVVMRILTDDSHSVMRFGSKFGAPVSSWGALIRLARDLGLNLIGISFHVGSGCMSPVAFTEALRRVRTAFDLGEKYGFGFNFLDIGGGFPGEDTGNVNFPEIARAIAPVLEELFPPHVRVIGEPGRFMAMGTHTLAVSVYARRQLDESMRSEVANADNLNYLYYVNDGVYGSFNCIFFDHAAPTPLPLVEKSGKKYASKLFGPTCDSMDVVCPLAQLPELDVGDWLYFTHMGAYTTASSSRFNGFKTSSFYYVYTLPPPAIKLD